MKVYERDEAKRMRREDGESIKEIAKCLGVSPGSVSRWVRDVPLTFDQRRSLENRTPNRMVGAQTNRKTARKRRNGFQQSGAQMAAKQNPLFVGGCMLYWAEGRKSRNSVGLCNTDIHLLRYFLKFLVECYQVSQDNIVLFIQYYETSDVTEADVINHWCSGLDLPISCLRSISMNPRNRSSARKKRGKHLYGICEIAVHRTQIVQSIYGAIQELGGFSRECWLD